MGIALLSTGSLISYYLYFFLKLVRHKEQSQSSLPPVSIIVAARNERPNLSKNLPLLLAQDYPDFEVVVVNDGSFDGSADLLNSFQSSNAHLKLVDLKIDERYQKGKKFALTMGIKAASNEQLLFTDADCKPSGKQWIRRMMEVKGSKPIVLGYAPLRYKFSLWAPFSYYETFHTAIQYLSYALRSLSYMGVGRNLSYTKGLFFANKGFASHQHLLSGDDDLFIQEVASANNVAICTHDQSFMYSDAPGGFISFIRQKRRHYSTSKHYSTRFKLLLSWYAFAQFFWTAAAVASIFLPAYWFILFPILGFKWLLLWPIMIQLGRRLKTPWAGYLLPLFDLLFSLYLLISAFIIRFSAPKRWK